MQKLYAFIGSLQHYAAIAREALKQEKEGPAELKRKGQELEFLPAVLEVTDSPPSPLGRIILGTVMTFFVIAIAWANIGEMDIISTAQGKIIPSGKVKIIQPLETGVVKAIHVRDGQKVKAGDVLIELNPTGAAADEARLTRELMSARVTIARLEALLFDNPLDGFFPPDGAPDDLVARNRRHLESAYAERQARLEASDNEVIQRRAEIRTTKVEIKRLKMILPNVRERVESRRTLLDKGYTPRLDFLELEQQLIDTEQQLLSANSKLNELQAALRATTSRRDQMIAEGNRTTEDQLSDITNRAEGVEQDLIKAQDRNRRQKLTAPVDGVVQQLAIHTEGGVVTPAQELMTIVPQGHIEIEAMVMNKDIGFVVEGQDAEIKVESFPFTKYGTLRGNVRTVSRDAVMDDKQGLIYPARFDLWETEIIVGNKYVTLTPGMSVTVEIKTGKRKPIQYILAPLQEYQSESLKER